MLPEASTWASPSMSRNISGFSVSKQKQPLVAQTTVLDLRNRSVPRGGKQNPNEKPLEVSRGVKQLNVYLPLGSPEGPYDMRITTTVGETVFATSGVASLKNGITSVEVTVDLSSGSRGQYVLQVRRPGSEWTSYPLILG